MRKSLNSLKRRLPYGIPELFIPPIDPLIIPEVKLNQTTGAIYMNSVFKDVHIYGLSNYSIIDISVDPKKLKITMSFSFPNVTMEATYEMKGKILMMPLAGKGDCRANFCRYFLCM